MKSIFLLLPAILLGGCSTISAIPSSSVPIVDNDQVKEKVSRTSLRPMSSITAIEHPRTQEILNCSSKSIDYIPIPPIPAGGYTETKVENNKIIITPQNWNIGEESAKKNNALLNNIATNIAYSDHGGGAKLASFSADHNRKQYVIDFMKFRIEPMTNSENLNTPIGWARVGVGLRIIVDITKSSGEISGSLLALAASAKANKTQGSISVELIGIDSPEVTASMPFTVELSEGNIQKVIETLAIVKTKLYDNTTTIHPNFISRLACRKE
ncbi:Uncharacterised protein [uncultured Comamonas sp.]|nr:Uncharacterised protein [uncultured Comamonas sp.]